MFVSRNTIGTAFNNLFTPLGPQGTPPVLYKTVGGKWKHYKDISTDDQPALFTLDLDENTSEARTYGLNKWQVKKTIWIYDVSAQDPSVDPEVVLNDLIDAVDHAIHPPFPYEGNQDLGLPGVVANCYINGTIVKIIGVLGPQTVAVIPVTIDLA